MPFGRPCYLLKCSRCLRGFQAKSPCLPHDHRLIHFNPTSSPLPHENGGELPLIVGGTEEERPNSADQSGGSVQQEAVKPGAMSRRLSQMTDETIEQGGRSIYKTIDEGGFSDELKNRLEARINESAFESEHQAAFSQMNMPVCL